MKKRKTKERSTVEQTADALRRLAARSGGRTLLGSEDELCETLSVSRPTLRQAASLVAQERLIEVRRGVNGGYYAVVPDTVAVTRMASIYLKAHGTTMIELIEAIAPLRLELAKRAARHSNPKARALLQEFLGKDQAQGLGPVTYKAFLRAEREFGALLCELSENRLWGLFLSILYNLVAQVVAPHEDVYAHHQDRIDTYRSQRNLMIAALLDGDEEMVMLATKRCTATVTSWMLDDLRSRAAPLIEFEPVDQPAATPAHAVATPAPTPQRDRAPVPRRARVPRP